MVFDYSPDLFFLFFLEGKRNTANEDILRAAADALSTLSLNCSVAYFCACHLVKPNKKKFEIECTDSKKNVQIFPSSSSPSPVRVVTCRL